MFVLITPGQTVVSPTPAWSSSARRQSPNMNTAALLVEYAFIDCCGEYAAIDEMLTMCPPVPRSTSRRPNDLQQLTTPPKLISSTLSNSSAGVSRNSPAWPTPALLITMSGTPWSALTWPANCSTASASETSRG